MPEDFLKQLQKTTQDQRLKQLIIEHPIMLKNILVLYEDYRAMNAQPLWYEDENELYDPPGCFQC